MIDIPQRIAVFVPCPVCAFYLAISQGFGANATKPLSRLRHSILKNWHQRGASCIVSMDFQIS
jgi:hypothetical protein